MTAIDPSIRATRTTCPYCGVGCGVLATPDNKGGAAISGDPDHPANLGRLCSKGSALGETLSLEGRLLYPMIRCAKGVMERIAWSDALDHVAHRLQHIIARDGANAVAFYLSGQLLTEDYYVANKLMKGFIGSANVDTNSRLCMSSTVAGHRRAFGADTVPGCYEDLDEADLLVLVGSNTAWCHPVLYQRMLANKQKRGARMIVIDPRRTDTVGDDDLFLGLKPGTDTALFSGLLVHLADNGALDRDYIAKHTVGFEALAQRVKRYTPHWAAQTCGITREEVVQLAREYGGIRPAAIRLNYGMQRHTGGGIAARTIACLPALVGAWRDAAGGIVLSTADFYGFDHAALERADLLAGRRPRVINQSQLGDALTTAQPPVRAMIVYNNNPVAVCPESDKVIAGFSRDDLFTVVMDHFQTDTADYADIVLPATTQLEHYDVHKSYGHLYVLANNPAIAPVGESLPNSEVFRRLAARMGFDEPCFRDSDEDICRTALASSKEAMRGIEWNALKKAGWQKLGLPERFTPFAAGGFPTASGKCEFYSEWLQKQGVDPLPFYNPPVEAPGADTELARKYPLAFISPPARHFLNSSFANLARFREFEREPHLDMHRSDAERRGIRDGDLVRIFNDRGGYTLRARVNGKPRPGVVVAPSVWWKKYSRDGGNANNVTSQRTTDLGGGATFYDCLVEVQKVA